MVRCAVSRSRPRLVSSDVQLSVVLAVLAGELSMTEAARRHGVSAITVDAWPDRFIAAGREGLVAKKPGPPGPGTMIERRLRGGERAAQARPG
ncbi:helix-turn-helix domain-containing protein [Kineococcus xinjiangensis]|uniref:helix-turn-helix domain-containing protein n=1 Tax=Kineococcus xinjiangensis TaxID=512762 RepID=UPI003CCC048A